MLMWTQCTLLLLLCEHVRSFVHQIRPNHVASCTSNKFCSLNAARGFGGSPSSSSSSSSNKGSNKKTKSRLSDALADKPKNSASKNMPYVKSESAQLVASIQAQASDSCLGRAVASGPYHGTPQADDFWEFMPSLIQSKFPNVPDSQLERVAGFLRHTVHEGRLKKEGEMEHPLRPLEDIHAYMPGLGPTQPFYDPNQLEFCQKLSQNWDTILQEYQALVDEMKRTGRDRFQSVTNMNYESGWKTVVLFYNGHRIKDFPYTLCPVTTKLLETMPIAGRIAGFNRQNPNTGIPRHTDGNNMWLTCQMGLVVPDNEMAYITVADETRHWKKGECLLYDTTYWHETFNKHPTQERVVLHVDFFNTLAMTPIEIQVMQYIYSLREQFMKAEGVRKVDAQIL